MEDYKVYSESSYNKMYINNETLEAMMVDSDSKKQRVDCGEPRLIFQFPPRSFRDDEIKMEVRSIMTGALREQLQMQRTS